MHKPSFHRTPLATGVALALGAAVTSPVVAQEGADDDVIEEIVTTGYRSSLMQSMDRKRNAKGVVDAITAEDIGKFPDTNLAESLQRIPGVAIDRSNNEGSKITVRGFGPEFNLVTLNGRSMPSAGSRSFDFLDIATEAVSAVEIYKTAKANLPTGGIGATVNMITARPLNVGFQSVVGVKAVHETSAGEGRDLKDFTPEISGLFSNVFADDTIGVLVSASYQARENREEFSDVARWYPVGEGFDRPLPSDTSVITDNNQRADGVSFAPQNANAAWADITRERTNAQLVLQYAPSDRLTATLDYTFSQVDTEKDQNGFGIWFDAGDAIKDLTINERGTWVQVTESGRDYANNIIQEASRKQNDSIGLNLEWHATDSMTLSLDAHSSKSSTKGTGVGGDPTGSKIELIVGNTFCNWCGFADNPGTFDSGPFTAGLGDKTASYGAGGTPFWDFDVIGNSADGPFPQDEFLPQDMGSLGILGTDDDTENTINQIQLEASWINESGGAIAQIDVGLSYTDQEFDSRGAFSGFLLAGVWEWSAGVWPDDVWIRESSAGILSEFSGGPAVDYYYTVPIEQGLDIMETVQVAPCANPGCDNVSNGGVFWPSWGPDYAEADGSRGRAWAGPLSDSTIVEEEIASLYAQIVMEDEFNGMPFNAVLGLRYEDAETTSVGTDSPPSGVSWNNANEWTYIAGESQRSSGSGKTQFFLPSLDIDMEVIENVITRFSYSRSIARPGISQLGSTRNFAGTPNVGTRIVDQGNPALLPYVSDNFDLSVEWYYGEGSYVSVGYFNKEVDNWIVASTTQTTFPDLGLRDPQNGPRAAQAEQDLIDANEPVTNQNLFDQINANLGNTTPPLPPILEAPEDPLMVFSVSTFDNLEDANLFGMEFAVQHLFGESGWGVQANATIVNGDVEADPDILAKQFALTGLSDTANFTVFFENDLLSARLAYNWRDKFLSGFGEFDTPIFVEDYQQLDANVTWFATDRLAVFLEGINITEETQRSYFRYPEQFQRGAQYGARWSVGARYNFD
jgi:TonB-dependent receptor